MVDVTVASFEEMEPIYDGVARRARATLGVSGWGMQVMALRRTGTGIRTTSTTRAWRMPTRRRSTSRSRIGDDSRRGRATVHFGQRLPVGVTIAAVASLDRQRLGKPQ